MYWQAVLVGKKLVLDTSELLSELSIPLRAEVALHRCHTLIMSPTFIKLLGGAGTALDPLRMIVMRQRVLRVVLTNLYEECIAADAIPSVCPAGPAVAARYSLSTSLATTGGCTEAIAGQELQDYGGKAGEAG